jgi:membrane-associated phospholipid phosphatase
VGGLKRRRRTSGSPLRALAWVAVGAGIALPLARRRLRLPAPVTLAAVAAAPIGITVAAPRTRKRDVALYALQMWAYIVVHELPYDRPERLERRVHVEYPIKVDETLFGSPPTVVLQRALARPGRPTILDYTLVSVHWAWFLQPHAAAAWVLWRHPDRFPRAATLICAVFDLGVLGYIAVPTAPPWWAADQGLGPTGMRRIMVDVGQRVWGSLWAPLYRFLGGNPLAAMPSLHFGTSVMAASVLSDFGPVPAMLGWGYASVLGFALVYLGEHYVVDLAAGLALATAVRAGAPLAAPAAERLGRALQQLEVAARA